jgi:Contractile injection system tube protein
MQKCAFTFYDEQGILDPKTRFEADYNPTEFTLSKNVQFAEHPIPGLDSPILQFVRGQAETTSLDLFFDTSDDGMGRTATAVTTRTDPFYRLVKIDGKLHAPRICLFSWGASGFAGSYFKDGWESQKRHQGLHCVIESMRQRFTLFSSEGVPLRATLTVGLKEYKSVQKQLDELNPQSADQTHAYTLRQGETLNDIANAVYGDPNAWRPIADLNQVADPLAVPAGSILEIPPLR